MNKDNTHYKRGKRKEGKARYHVGIWPVKSNNNKPGITIPPE